MRDKCAMHEATQHGRPSKDKIKKRYQWLKAKEMSASNESTIGKHTSSRATIQASNRGSKFPDSERQNFESQEASTRVIVIVILNAQNELDQTSMSSTELARAPPLHRREIASGSEKGGDEEPRRTTRSCGGPRAAWTSTGAARQMLGVHGARHEYSAPPVALPAQRLRAHRDRLVRAHLDRLVRAHLDRPVGAPRRTARSPGATEEPRRTRGAALELRWVHKSRSTGIA